jgi:hypothetical protein
VLWGGDHVRAELFVTRASHGTLFRFNVLEPSPTSGAQIASGLLNAAQEARIALKSIFEPAALRLGADHLASFYF